MNIFNKINPFKSNKDRGQLSTVSNPEVGDPEAGNSGGLRKHLYEAATIQKIYGSILSIPDPDAILKKAGLTRKTLLQMEGDDEIYGAISKRRGKLLGMSYHFEKEDGMTDTAFEFIQEIMIPVINTILKDSWSALLYGYSVIEIVYKQRADGKVGFADVTRKPFDWFRINPNTLELKYFAPDGSGYSSEGITCDTVYKFFVTRHEADYQNPHGVALLSKLYWPWMFRHEGWKYFMQWLERFGIPTITVKTDQTSIDERNKLAESLAISVQDSVLIVGSTDDVNLVESEGKGEPFANMENMLTKRILKTILGGTLNTDVQDKGAKAASETHRDELTDKRDSDARMVSPTVQFIVNAITSLNFPNQPPPKFIMEDDKGLQKQRADRDAILSKTGVKFSKQYMVKSYEFGEEDIEVAEIVDSEEDDREDSEKDNTKDNTKKKPANDSEKQAASLKHIAQLASQNSSIQNAVDSISDAIYRQIPDPVDPAMIFDAIKLSKNADDLRERLEKMIDKIDLTFHQETLQRAFYQAHVLGYVDSEGKL